MPDPLKPETWTPEYAWSLLDQVLMNAHLSEISREMQEKSASAKSLAHFEGQQKGNAAFYPAERIRQEELLTDEWAEKIYRAALQVWEVQGHRKCRAFYRMVYERLLASLIAARRSTVIADMALEDRRIGKIGRTSAHMRSFARAMDRLRGHWNTKMEVATREHGYSEKIARQNPTTEPVQQATVVIRPRKKQASSPSQMRRLGVIFAALEACLKGPMYSRALDERGIAVPLEWRDRNCPARYQVAYRDPKWRIRIQNEKHKAKLKYDQMTADERRKVIEYAHSPTRRTRR
jgi:hypothetical protein